MILYARQQKRHRCKKEATELCGRRRGWDDMREQHWNMYITICITDDQCKFDAWSRALKAGALGQPRGMGWEGKWKGSLEKQDGGHTCPWLIHVEVWQKSSQYCKVIILQLKPFFFFQKKNRHNLSFCLEDKMMSESETPAYYCMTWTELMLMQMINK